MSAALGRNVGGYPVCGEFTVGAGVSAKMTDRLALFTSYRAVLPTGNTTVHTLEAGLHYRF